MVVKQAILSDMLAPVGYGKELQAARIASGKGLRDTAKALGVSAGYLSRVENEKAEPMTTLRTLNVARFLGADPIPLVMLLQKQRGEAKLAINGDTEQRKAFAAILEILWTERAITPAQIDRMRDVLRETEGER